MPEYSSTTITPADAVQIPAMNGSTSGNFTMSAATSYYLSSKGQANGLASLDANGKLTESEIPSAVTTDLGVLDKRVTNLEQAAGDYSEVNYKDAPYGVVPSSKAEYAGLTTIRGVTRACNQLAVTISADTYQYSSGSTCTFSDGVAYFTASSTGERVWMKPSVRPYLIASHAYYVSAEIYLTTATTLVSLTCGDNAFEKSCESKTGWQTITIVDTASTSAQQLFGLRDYRTSDWDEIRIKNIQVVDLTLLGASDTSSVSTVLAQFPQLGQYNSYDAGSLVSNTISGLTSKGRNLFNPDDAVADERWNSSGTATASGTTRSPMIPIEPSTAYYFMGVHGWVTMACAFWFDIGGNYLSSSHIGGSSPQSGSLTSPSGAYYLGVNLPSSSVDSCCVNKSDSLDGTFTEYFSTTLTLPTPFSGKSAGSVADELDVETGEITRNVGTVDLGTLTWTLGSDDSAGLHRFNGTLTVGSYQNFTTTYKNSSTSDTHTAGTDELMIHSSNLYPIVFTADYSTVSDFTAAMSGVYLSYVLAIPYTDPATPTPLTDNFISTEAGGTLTPTQTQTPSIDVDFDMEYLTV